MLTKMWSESNINQTASKTTKGETKETKSSCVLLPKCWVALSCGRCCCFFAMPLQEDSRVPENENGKMVVGSGIRALRGGVRWGGGDANSAVILVLCACDYRGVVCDKWVKRKIWKVVERSYSTWKSEEDAGFLNVFCLFKKSSLLPSIGDFCSMVNVSVIGSNSRQCFFYFFLSWMLYLFCVRGPHISFLKTHKLSF